MSCKNKNYTKEEKIREFKSCPVAMLLSGKDAQHCMRNINRDQEYGDQEIIIRWESKNFYYGNFLEGFGFVDVAYKKKDVRELTEDEINRIKDIGISLGARIYNSPIQNPEDVWRKDIPTWEGTQEQYDNLKEKKYGVVYKIK